MMLTRDQILAADDITTEEVHVPLWGGTVLVRGMTGTERNLFEDACTKEIPAGNRAGRRAGQTVTKFVKDNIMAKLCALGAWWTTTARSCSRMTDIDALGKKSGAALQRVMEVAMRLSGLDDDDIDDMAKDLQERPFVDSSSA